MCCVLGAGHVKTGNNGPPLITSEGGQVTYATFSSHCQSTRILFTQGVFPKEPCNMRTSLPPVPYFINAYHLIIGIPCNTALTS